MGGVRTAKQVRPSDVLKTVERGQGSGDKTDRYETIERLIRRAVQRMKARIEGEK